MCKQVEHPQPELIVFFGVTGNSRQPVLKKVCDCSLFAIAVEVMNPIWHSVEDQVWPIPVEKQVFEAACPCCGGLPLLFLFPITAPSPGHPRPGSNLFNELGLLLKERPRGPESHCRPLGPRWHPCSHIKSFSYPAQDINYLNLITFGDRTDVPYSRLYQKD